MTIEIRNADIQWGDACVSCGRPAEDLSSLLPANAGTPPLSEVPFCKRCNAALSDNRRSRPRNALLGLLGALPAALSYFAVLYFAESELAAIWIADAVFLCWFLFFTVGGYIRRRIAANKYGQAGVYNAGRVLRADRSTPCYIVSIKNQTIAEEIRERNGGKRRPSILPV